MPQRANIGAQPVTRAAEPARLARGQRVAACLIVLASFIDIMGSTSVFAAGPAIESAIGLTQVGLQWAFTAASLPAGALLLVGGRLADLYGRRRMFRIGLGLLVVSSLAGGLARSVGELLAARVAQGVAGALLLPAALSLLLNLFATARGRTKALATWSVIGGVGATVGLVLGGLVTAGLGWPWVFWLNVPLGLIVLGASPYVLREAPRAGTSRALDLAGIVTSTAALAGLIYAITQAPAQGWLSMKTVGLLVLALTLSAIFVCIESRSDHAMIPPRLLRAGTVLRGNVVLFTAGMSVDGLLFTLTLYTQRSLGFSALQFGLITAVMTLGSVGTAYAAERAIASLGTDRIANIGLGLLGVTCLCFAATVRWGGSVVPLTVGMLLFGAGMGCAYVAGSIASLHGVPHHESGIAAGIQNIAFTLGTILGVAVFSTVSAAQTQRLIAAGSGPVPATRGGLEAAFTIGAVVAACGLVAVVLSPADPASSTQGG